MSKIQSVELKHNYSNQYYQRLSYDIDFFKFLSPSLCHLLGWLAADGGIVNNTTRLCLHKQDVDILVKFKKILSADQPILSYRSYRYFSITDKKLPPILKSYNLTPRKTFTVTIPDIILNNDEYFWSYLRGLFEGDGCICLTKEGYFSKKEKTIKFCPKVRATLIGNIRIINQISLKLFSSIKVSMRTRGRVKELSILGGNKGVINFLDKLYKNKEILYLNRKYKKYLESKETINV